MFQMISSRTVPPDFALRRTASLSHCACCAVVVMAAQSYPAGSGPTPSGVR